MIVLEIISYSPETKRGFKPKTGIQRRYLLR